MKLVLGLLVSMTTLSAVAQVEKPFYGQFGQSSIESEDFVQSLDGKWEVSEISLADAKIEAGRNHLEDLANLSLYGQINKSNIGAVIATANQLIALGEKIYKIIEKGRPVLQTSYAPISVLPKNADGSAVETFEMSNWSIPSSRSFSVKYKNLYGMSVVNFTFTLVFAYGGGLDGKGKYITAAQIVPANVEVSWGYNVSATMNLDGIFNTGSKEDPVAGALLKLTYKVSTIVKADENNIQFYIGGDGRVKQY